jgi:hypothetical protein
MDKNLLTKTERMNIPITEDPICTLIAWIASGLLPEVFELDLFVFVIDEKPPIIIWMNPDYGISDKDWDAYSWEERRTNYLSCVLRNLCEDAWAEAIEEDYNPDPYRTHTLTNGEITIALTFDRGEHETELSVKYKVVK